MFGKMIRLSVHPSELKKKKINTSKAKLCDAESSFGI